MLDLTPHRSVLLNQMLDDYERKISADDSDIEPPKLTEREQEILVLLASGYTTAQIAARCTITLDTVKAHNGNIFSKLGAQNAREAVAIALKSKMVGIDQLALRV